MKIGIVGAGAIGGLIAVRLSLAGQPVSVVDRGAHLNAIRKNGLRLVHADGSEEVATNLRAVATCAEAGEQDLVFLAVKANQIAPLAPQLAAMFHRDTAVIPLQNGLPWWYFQKFSGPHGGYRMRTADPDGVIAAHIDPARIVGCVVYPAGEIVAPGVVKHVEGDRFPIGELDGAETERVKQISEIMTKAGLKAPILADIRSEIWLKLWGNLSFNPISALTHATLVDVCQDPTTRALAGDMMREAQAIGEKLGATFRVPLEKRIAGAEKVGKHKTSTLQDVEAGRAIEIDALIGSVKELGELTGVATPHIDAVYALMTLLARTMEAARAKVVLEPVREEAST
ncbi:MAG TPA: 2-dehydropantoate 2-reductase [Casimicrobiaceae bacterium]|nr:2-dehydropantoate 2-reductase [Casimicrobiaceae bacterium]